MTILSFTTTNSDRERIKGKGKIKRFSLLSDIPHMVVAKTDTVKSDIHNIITPHPLDCPVQVTNIYSVYINNVKTSHNIKIPLCPAIGNNLECVLVSDRKFVGEANGLLSHCLWHAIKRLRNLVLQTTLQNQCKDSSNPSMERTNSGGSETANTGSCRISYHFLVQVVILKLHY